MGGGFFFPVRFMYFVTKNSVTCSPSLLVIKDSLTLFTPLGISTGSNNGNLLKVRYHVPPVRVYLGSSE